MIGPLDAHGPARAKALGYLRSGSVRITHATRDDRTDPTHLPPARVLAYVRSGQPEGLHWPPYEVVRVTTPPEWSCSCGWCGPTPACPHVLAVALVTGWTS